MTQLSQLLSDAAEALARTRACWLVTRSESGVPRSRPMSLLPVDPSEGWLLRLVTDARTRKVDEIWRDQRVSLLCHPRGGAFVAAAGVANLVFDPDEVKARWRAEYDPFFPGEKRAEAVFLEVDVDCLDLWVVNALHEPLGFATTTLQRDAHGRWTIAG